jgi:HD-GYP domain-containing protein (c-di-GMP phosphodiesterase class II)
VADTFRALVSHRPYQKQYNLNEAIEVVRHRAGTMFDPKVVEVFVECVNRHADRFRTISSEAEAPAEAERTAH